MITQATQPPPHRTRWSVRAMARQTGVSPESVQRIWAANEIKSHLTRTFKLSRAPNFEAKFWDVIGLYRNPPYKALVLCCDEGLPLGIGHTRIRTHDYTRHGTVTLFAALNYLDGRILGTTAPQHALRCSRGVDHPFQFPPLPAIDVQNFDWSAHAEEKSDQHMFCHDNETLR